MRIVHVGAESTEQVLFRVRLPVNSFRFGELPTPLVRLDLFLHFFNLVEIALPTKMLYTVALAGLAGEATPT